MAHIEAQCCSPVTMARYRSAGASTIRPVTNSLERTAESLFSGCEDPSLYVVYVVYVVKKLTTRPAEDRQS
jgi:hypothetical protein